MKLVPFFSDRITLIPHTATHAHHIGRELTVQAFADDSGVSLYKLINGDLLARLPSGTFIEGPEAPFSDDVIEQINAIKPYGSDKQ